MPGTGACFATTPSGNWLDAMVTRALLGVSPGWGIPATVLAHGVVAATQDVAPATGCRDRSEPPPWQRLLAPRLLHRPA
jgi:hypothetical protein